MYISLCDDCRTTMTPTGCKIFLYVDSSLRDILIYRRVGILAEKTGCL